MATVLKKIALEVVLLMTKVFASVLEYGIGLLVNPAKEFFSFLSSKNTDLRIWFYNVIQRLEAMIDAD